MLIVQGWKIVQRKGLSLHVADSGLILSTINDPPAFQELSLSTDPEVAPKQRS